MVGWQFVCFYSYFAVIFLLPTINCVCCISLHNHSSAHELSGVSSTLTYKICPVFPHAFASELISLRQGREDQTIILSSYFDVSVTKQESKVLPPDPSHLEP